MFDRNNCFSVFNNIFGRVGLKSESIINGDKVEAVVVKRLAVSNVSPKNRPPESKTKTRHIAFTGNERELIFSRVDLDDAYEHSKSTDYSRMMCYVSLLNIDCLLGGPRTDERELDTCETYTHRKIEVRSKGLPQVQISQTTKDDSRFLELRNGLYTDDYLVLLKLREGGRILFIGIKKEWLKDEEELNNAVIFFPSDEALNNNVDEEDTSDNPICSLSEEMYDAMFQDEVNKILVDEKVSLDDDELPELSPGTRSDQKSNREIADPRKTAEVIAASGYKCFFSGDGHEHMSFLKEDGTKYYEGHHFVMLSYKYPFKLDKKANIVCLCALCHRKIHYGNSKVKTKMIKEIYDVRKDKLQKCGIIVPLEDILKMYGVKEE